jgi:hypothetical protein
MVNTGRVTAFAGAERADFAGALVMLHCNITYVAVQHEKP